ncbi:hypothetical protein [Nocardia crassostreae]|uniref:hypothetical protein n=1 Tax=Nocardia crassostreae TaxID=53428 RepID=UPI000A3E70AA|nr:hypothetical protein [Nocardia crassostreae]
MPRIWSEPRARRIGAVVLALAFALLIVSLGVAIPPRPAVISTDRLGPENGEQIPDYLARAQESLRGADTDGHWALISFTVGITADRIPEYSAGLRISQAIYHVSVPRAAMPIVAVTLPAGEAVAVASVRSAAAQAGSLRGYDDRTIRVNRLTATRLAANCACLVGLVVHGTLDELRNLAGLPGVRAVEALPADAPAGVFAVAPLLPEYQTSANPGPDDAPIPDN